MSQNQNQPSRRACKFCRKRKLRCSRDDPCNSCQKFGFECQYNTAAEGLIRKTSTKVSRVQQLESRLGHVEQLLQSASQNAVQKDAYSSHTMQLRHGEVEDLADLDASSISLLEQAFFDFVNPVINIIHQRKYTESTITGITTRPSYLRYAIYSLGALKLEAYSHWSERLYHSSRRKLEEAELKDDRLDRVNLFQCQAWILIAAYELQQGYFHRVSMSTARAVQLLHLLRVHRHDTVSCVRDPALILVDTAKDITEAEERRRVFWQAFLLDRYNSVSLNTPPLIQEKDICTYLPASNEAFAEGYEEQYLFLSEALKVNNCHRISSFAASVVLLSRAGLKMTTLERFDIDTTMDAPTEIAFTKDVVLLNALTTVYNVPEHLNLSNSLLEPSLAYLHTATPTATIIVHRTARFRDYTNSVSTGISLYSKKQCLEAANNIIMIMEMTSGWDPRAYHFLTVYSVYSAASVFAASWLDDRQPCYEKSLRFLLSILESFKRHVQLAQIMLQDIDAEFPVLRELLELQDRPPGAIQRASLQLTSSGSVSHDPRSDASDNFSHLSEYGLLCGETILWNTEEDLPSGGFLS
ncbi:hypothetical protein BDZ45DRAFT_671888 [Acephala macrosclerotiorum]|nr:hypothetical protein BDZ45DRAFT_671888 [Acephala macrosclerotiorum]